MTSAAGGLQEPLSGAQKAEKVFCGGVLRYEFTLVFPGGPHLKNSLAHPKTDFSKKSRLHPDQ